MADLVDLERREDWRWFFDQLLLATRRVEEPCQLNLPDTIMFRDGQPVSWLATNADGYIVERQFPPRTRVQEGMSIRDVRLEAVRFAFIEFRGLPVESMRGEQFGDVPLMTVFYKDGKNQVLDVRSFDQLRTHTLWLEQVMAVQAFSIVDTFHTGYYAVTPLTRVELESQMNPYAKKLGRYLEAASRTDDAFDHKAMIGHTPKTERLRIIRMVARFMVDDVGKLWVTHLESVTTRRDPPEPRIAKRDKAAETETDALTRVAADEAERDLRDLMRHAVERGLDFTRCFAHFDPAGLGMVTANDFIGSLKLLGIDVHPAAAKALVRRIPRNLAGLIGIEQFRIWLSTGPDAIQEPGAKKTRKGKVGRGGAGGAGSSVTGVGGAAPAAVGAVDPAVGLPAGPRLATSASLRRMQSASTLEVIDETEGERLGSARAPASARSGSAGPTRSGAAAPSGDALATPAMARSASASSLGSIRAAARLEAAESTAAAGGRAATSSTGWFGNDTWFGETQVGDDDHAGAVTGDGRRRHETARMLSIKGGKSKAKSKDPKQRSLTDSRDERARRRAARAKRRAKHMVPGWIGFRETQVSADGPTMNFDDYKLDSSSSDDDETRMARSGKRMTAKERDMAQLPSWARPSTKKALDELREAQRRKASGATGLKTTKDRKKATRIVTDASAERAAAAAAAQSRSLLEQSESLNSMPGTPSHELSSAGVAGPSGSTSPTAASRQGDVMQMRAPSSPGGTRGTVRFADAGSAPATPSRRGQGTPLAETMDSSGFGESLPFPTSAATGTGEPMGQGPRPWTVGSEIGGGVDEEEAEDADGNRMFWLSDYISLSYQVSAGPPVAPLVEAPGEWTQGATLVLGDRPPTRGEQDSRGSVREGSVLGGKSTPGFPRLADGSLPPGATQEERLRAMERVRSPLPGSRGASAPSSPSRPMTSEGGKEDKSIAASGVGEAAALLAAQDRGLHVSDVLSIYSNGRPVDLVVIPGILDSVKWLAEELRPMMPSLPGSRMLFVGLPGQPGTAWDGLKTLDNMSLADHVMALLTRLRGRGVWGDSNDGLERDIVLMGLGHGANVAMLLASDHFHRKGNKAFAKALSRIVVFNGHAFVDKGLKRTLGRLQRYHAALRAKPQPKPGRRKKKRRPGDGVPMAAVERVASPQRRSRSPGATRPRSVGGATSGSESEREAARNEAVVHLENLLWGRSFTQQVPHREAEKQFRRYFPGLLEGDQMSNQAIAAQAKGALASSDIRSAVAQLKVPLLLVAGTEDSFILPLHTRAMARSRAKAELAEELGEDVADDDVPDPSLSLEDWLAAERHSRATHVAWLKAGHLLLQERRAFVLRLVEQVVLGRVLHRSSPDWVDETAPEPLITHTEERSDSDEERKKSDADALRDKAMGMYWGEKTKPRVSTGDPKEEGLAGILKAGFGGSTTPKVEKDPEQDMDRVRAELKKRRLPLDGADYELLARLEDALEKEQAEAEAKRKLQQDRERAKAADRKAERIAAQRRAADAKRRMEERASRLSAADQLREQAALAIERTNMRREWQDMAAAEVEAKQFNQYLRDVAMAKRTAEYGPEMVGELAEHKAAVIAHKAALKKEARAAAEREARREKAHAMREEIANQAVVVEEDKLGYALDSDNPAEIAEGVERLVNAVGQMRSRKRASVARWRRLDTRLNGLESEVSSLRNEIKGVDRALEASIREAEAAMKYGGDDELDEAVAEAAAEEQEDLRIKREELVPLLDAVEAQLTLAKGEMDGVNTNVQRIAIAAKEKEDLLSAMRIKIARMIVDRRKLRQDKLDEHERMIAKSGETVATLAVKRRRIAELKAERARAKTLKSKMIDSSVWIEGVRQRVNRKQLLKFTKKELRQLISERGTIVAEAETFDDLGDQADAAAQQAETDLAVLRRLLRSVVSLQKQGLPKADDGDLKLRDHTLQWYDDYMRDKRELQSFVRELEQEGLSSLMSIGAKFVEGPDGKPHVSPETALAVATRWKPNSERTEEEREWVGIDRHINPAFYANATQEDITAFENEPIYTPKLPAATLMALAELPSYLAVAIHQIHNEDELRAYSLIQKYNYGRGEEEARLKDLQSGALAAKKAAVARGYAARIKPPAMRTREEAEWVAHDRVLRPELYPSEDPLITEIREKEAKERAEREEKEARLRKIRQAIEFGEPDHESTDADSEARGGVQKVAAAADVDDDDESVGSSARSDPGLETRRNLRSHFRHLLSFKKAREKRRLRRLHKASGADSARSAHSDADGNEGREDGDEAKPLPSVSEGKGEEDSPTKGAARDAAALEDDKTKVEAKDEPTPLHLLYSSLPPPRETADSLTDYDHLPEPFRFASPFTKDELEIILSKPSAALAPKEQRAQMLLRGYGSDDGEYMFKSAARAPTSVVSHIADAPETQVAAKETLHQRGEVNDIKAALRGSVAAAAARGVNGVVMMHTDAHQNLFQVTDQEIKLGETQEHVFEVPPGMSVQDFTVAVTFRGEFDARGYVLPHLSTALYRLPLVDPATAMMLQTATGAFGPPDGGGSRPQTVFTVDGSVGPALRVGTAAANGRRLVSTPGNAATADSFGFQDSRPTTMATEMSGTLPWSAASGESDSRPHTGYMTGPGGSDIPRDRLLSESREIIGYPMLQQTHLCTAEQMGRVTFRHEPLFVPVLPGAYAVQVTGLSRARYSINVTAHLVYTGEQGVEGAVKNAIHAKTRIPEIRKEMEDLEFSIRLGAWKRRLIVDLCAKTERMIDHTTRHVQRLRKALDEGVVVRRDLGNTTSDSDESEEETSSEEESEEETESSEEESSTEESTEESSSEWSSSEEYSEDDEEARAARKRRMRARIEVTARIRRKITAKVASLELDFANAVEALKTRRKELQDVMAGIRDMYGHRADREVEIERLKTQLRRLRDAIPLAIAALRADTEEEAAARRRASILHRRGMGSSVKELAKFKSRREMKRKATQDRLRAAQSRKEMAAKLDATISEEGDDGGDEDDVAARLEPTIEETGDGDEDEDEHGGAAETKGNEGEEGASESKAEASVTAKKPLARGQSHGADEFADLADSHVAEEEEVFNDEEHRLAAILRKQADKINAETDRRYPLVEWEVDDSDERQFGLLSVQWVKEQSNSGGDRPTDTPADKLRRKNLDDLTAEEREWMSYDRVLNPELYPSGDESDEDLDVKAALAADTTGGAVESGRGDTVDASKVAQEVEEEGKAEEVEGDAVEVDLGEDSDEERRRKKRKGEEAVEETDDGALATVYAGATSQEHTKHKRESKAYVVRAEKEAVVAAGLPGATTGANKRMRLNKYDKVLPVCPYSREELERIRTVPLVQLSREEVVTRKLLSKFHDRVTLTRDQLALDIAAHAATDSEAQEDKAEEDPGVTAERLAHPGKNPAAVRAAKALRAKQKRRAAGGEGGDVSSDGEDPGPGNRPPTFMEPLKARTTVRMILAAARAQRTATAKVKSQPRVRHDVEHLKTTADTDLRCKMLLQELDRAFACRKQNMDSFVLHNTEQRFPTKVLRLELERELDTLLLAQVFEREQISRDDYNSIVLKLRHQAKDAAEEAEKEKQEKIENERRSAALRAAQAIVNQKVYSNDPMPTIRRAQIAAKQGAETKAFGPTGMVDDEEEDPVRAMGNVIKWGTVKPPDAPGTKKVSAPQPNAAGAAKRRQELAAQKMAEAQSLGPGGCLACQTAPCQWEPTVDKNLAELRRDEVEREIDRVRKLPEEEKFADTEVAGSVMRGGISRMPKEDLLDELALDLKELKRKIRLNDVDKELHRAFASHEEYMETEVLHGYSQMTWRKDAIIALWRESNALIAQQVAYEIVDDIIGYMLEGWHFGERKSRLQLAGYVPSIRKDRPLRPSDSLSKQASQIVAAGASAKAEEDHLAEELIPRAYREEKWKVLDKRADGREAARKAVEAGSALDHNISQTENTLKFGLFLLTLEYFRGMSQLRMQRDLWGGTTNEKKAGGATGQMVTRQRATMNLAATERERRQRSIAKAEGKAKAGFDRRARLAEAELMRARAKLRENARRAARETKAAGQIQCAFRGHLARQAVKKWAIKKREIDAIRALRTASALAIQRIWRGYVGRLIVADKQKEMAAFIRMIRKQEEEELEEEYYATHTMERWKRDYRRWRGLEKAEEIDEDSGGPAKFGEHAGDSEASSEASDSEEELTSDEGSDVEDDSLPDGGSADGDSAAGEEQDQAGSADGDAKEKEDDASGSEGGGDDGASGGSGDGSEGRSGAGSGGGSEDGDGAGSDDDKSSAKSGASGGSDGDGASEAKDDDAEASGGKKK